MKRLSFAWKITLVFIMVAVCQGLLIAHYAHAYASDMVLKNKKTEIADLVNRIDININANIRYLSQQVETLSQKRILQIYLKSSRNPTNVADLEKAFEGITQSIPAVSNVFLLSKQELVYGRNPRNFPQPLSSDWQTIYRALEKKGEGSVWLGWIPNPFSYDAPSSMIAVASAVQNSVNYELDGVLLLELDTEKFAQLLLNNRNTFTDQYTFIVDKNRALLGSNKSLDPAWVAEIGQKFDASARRFFLNWQGQEYYVCGQYNGLTGWVTFSAIATHYILAQTDELARLIMLFALSSIGGVSIFIVFMSHGLTRPLQNLSTAMAHVHEGDFTQHVQTKREDEIGQLIASYNFMLSKINALINEVYVVKLAQKDAEIRTLQAQINPHFLYNTLDSINWMALDAGATQASESIIALGSLLQYSINQREELVSLERELDYVLSYLQIQKNRLEAALQYKVRIDERARNCLLPKLILQPLVENAILHGIDAKVKAGGTCVWIRVKKWADSIHICVADNGVGMDQETRRAILREGYTKDRRRACVGLYNVDRRLCLRYGEAFHIQIRSRRGRGTAVLLRIPLPQEKEPSD